VITARAWTGKSYAVLGLARSGAATVEALLASGARVVAWDANEEARASILSGTGEEENLTLADPLTLDLSGFAGVIVSPGVPINKHPIAAHARKFGVPLIGDIELFAQARSELPPHKVVGITGTNGKSTTTALVHHILKGAGVPTTMGGNIGLPILAQEPLPAGGVYVLELSSYQIDLTYSLDCDIAVLLNITPDHLDRYDGSFEAYAASKIRLFEMQSGRGFVVIGYDGAETRKIYDRMLHDRLAQLRIGKIVAASGADMDDQDFWYGWQDEPSWVGQSDWPSLQGPHNRENVAAAYHVALALGVELETLAEALSTYPGLPHRMERVRERDGVLFVNDSKATNPDSAAPALAAYPHIHWILGGLAKTASLGPCEQHLGHVRAAYTIGEAGPMFARLLHGKVPVTQSQVLDKAVTDAAAAARPGEVVLLSPACASFDQFSDFEARGEAFRAAVEAL
jgi:UDP-N-acetylmuramoylalanine--D-glutamate ligase